jgi:preprotein translocase subunit SecG
MNEQPEPNRKDDRSEHAFLWVLLGLAPILMVLVMMSYVKGGTAEAHTLYPIMLILVPACNLAGGIGCLRGIEDAALRIILGILLGAFFFVLTVVVAVFQACSQSNF